MKEPAILHRKNLLLIYLVMSYLLTFNIWPTTHVSKVAASPEVSVFVSPSLVTKNPGENLTIDINITNVIDLYSWEIKLGWKLGLLSFVEAEEGPFLKQGGDTFFTIDPEADYVMLGCSLLGIVPGVSGSGTLANITLTVEETGNSSLNLYDVTLINSNVEAIEGWDAKDSPDDGYFYTTLPVASFEYAPKTYGHPIVGETVTFNASASYDPDDPYDQSPGGIVSYEWDFGDGTAVKGTDPITTYSYSENGTYTVTLNVTDDDGESYIKQQEVKIQFHDIAIINITVAPTTVSAGGTVTINATVLNRGSETEYINITAYYNYNPIETKLFTYIDEWGREVGNLPSGQNATTTFIWNTTGLAPGNYTVGAYAYLVEPPPSYALIDAEENTADNTGFYDGIVSITGVPVHDIAVTSVVVDPINVTVGTSSSITVTIRNEGNMDETFNLTVYSISPQNQRINITKQTDLTLYPEKATTLTFSWYLADNETQEGTYTITANVTELEGETDITDNTHNVTVNMRLFPVAFFTYSPTQPIVGIPITFNASASYAPGTPAPGEDPGAIVSYEWDFGDGTSKIGEIVSHTYSAGGEYTVTLTVTDNDGLSNATTREVMVQKLNSTITVSASVATIQFGSNTTISGSIDPPRENVTVTIKYSESGEETWTTLTNVTTDKNGQYSYVWALWIKPGTYKIQATWQGDNATLPAESSIITINVIKKATSTINLSVSATTITIGAKITINGTISPIRAGVDVTIWHMTSGAEWSKLTTVLTDENGNYIYSWQPPNVGTYAIRASWLGDEVTEAAESEVQVIIVQETPTPNIFLYTTAGLGIIIVVMVALFFTKGKKP